MIHWNIVEGSQPSTASMKRWGTHLGHSIYSGSLGEDDYHIIRCQTCMYNHIVPLISEDVIIEYYQKSFYSVSKPDYVKQYNEDYKWWLTTHKYILNPHITHGSTFLDVGFGPGIAMQAAAQLGALSYGTELDGNRVIEERRRGFSVYAGTIDAYPGCPECLDVVYAWEVLEHLRDPEALLQSAYNLLKPGGVIIIEVPNDFSPLQRRAMEACGITTPWWVSPPEHLNYFNKLDLKCMVRRNGFRILEMRGTYPMENFLLNGRNYVERPEIGRDCHKERMEYELYNYKRGERFLYAMIRSYYENLELHDIGREIVCIAKKM